MDPFIAEIRIFAGNFAPKGWATCDGQVLPISQNTAVFALIGVNYGGDGRTTFALPNLKGVFPMGAGNGFGLTPRVVGESGGTTTVTLTQNQVPAHSHTLGCMTSGAGVAQPTSAIWVGGGRGRPPIYAPMPNPITNAVALSPQTIVPAGAGGSHNNVSPYLTLTFIFALQGVFPPRQ